MFGEDVHSWFTTLKKCLFPIATQITSNIGVGLSRGLEVKSKLFFSRSVNLVLDHLEQRSPTFWAFLREWQAPIACMAERVCREAAEASCSIASPCDGAWQQCRELHLCTLAVLCTAVQGGSGNILFVTTSFLLLLKQKGSCCQSLPPSFCKNTGTPKSLGGCYGTRRQGIGDHWLNAWKFKPALQNAPGNKVKASWFWANQQSLCLL